MATDNGEGRFATVSPQDIELGLQQMVLKKLVELHMAGWFDACLRTLQDDFGFDEGQLAEFARSFREKVDESQDKTAEAATDPE